MRDTTTDDTLEVEIDLDCMDWSELPPEEEAATPPVGATLPPAASAPHAPAPAVPMVTAAAVPAARPPLLPPAVADIVARVEPASLRDLVGSIFGRLLRALDTLAVIEKALTRPQAVKVERLFEEVRSQTASLLSHLTEAISRGDAVGGEVGESLDGMRFVIGHELSKVFRQEFPGINEPGRVGYSRADLSRAWGLLHNCLQQTAITLAQTFDPGATGPQLFEDYRSKVENSFTLYRELEGLLQKVTTAQKSNGILLKHSLIRHMEHFRGEVMHFLMYKDWGEFTRYVDDVKRAFEEMEEFESVLHGFAQYLETLIHHVGMREVLRGATPQAATAAGFAPRGPAARRPVRQPPA